MSETNIGTQIKLAVTLQCAGLTMDDFGFSVDFYTNPSRAVTIAKSGMIRESESQYVAIIDTADMSAGEIKMRVTADIPDDDLDGGLRKEILTQGTGISIRK